MEAALQCTGEKCKVQSNALARRESSVLYFNMWAVHIHNCSLIICCSNLQSTVQCTCKEGGGRHQHTGTLLLAKAPTASSPLANWEGQAVKDANDQESTTMYNESGYQVGPMRTNIRLREWKRQDQVFTALQTLSRWQIWSSLWARDNLISKEFLISKTKMMMMMVGRITLQLSRCSLRLGSIILKDTLSTISITRPYCKRGEGETTLNDIIFIIIAAKRQRWCLIGGIILHSAGGLDPSSPLSLSPPSQPYSSWW